MRIRYFLSSACVLCSLSGAAWGQNGVGGGITGPATPTTAPIETAMLPGGHVEGVPLQDYLVYLHERFPDFNSVIVRQPGVPDDYPKLPAMDLKNVTLGQFLDFVKALQPGIDVQRIDGPAAPLYVVHVGSGEKPGLPAGFFGGGRGGGPQSFSPPPDNKIVVEVYRLTDTINDLAALKQGEGDHTKQALDDVLSLLQTALDQKEEKIPAALKVHAATQTLVFKGSISQMEVVEQTLKALKLSDQNPQYVDLKKQILVLEAQHQEDLRRIAVMKEAMERSEAATPQPKK